ncbi:MAG: hypothetical protein Q8R02_17840 [Hyphomonadaceae bacterium]|nr:hypothetical protein [Hyphomonadaceae bacterium]
MKLSWRLVLGFLVSALALAACLPPFALPDEEYFAKTATVAAIPGLQRGAIVISDIRHESKRVSWQALTPEGVFNCDANQYFEWPACVRR